MNETIKKFEQGAQYLDIVSAVTESELTSLKGDNPDTESFTKAKFVPASGAATRMFKDLYAYLEDHQETEFIQRFFDHLEEFAFYEKVDELIAIDNLDKNSKEDRLQIVQAIVDTEMQYGDFPKALIDFHNYEDYIANPIDEHVYKATQYLSPENQNIHFTVAKKDEEAFKAYINKKMEENSSLNITYSFQDETTDTLAVALDNKPFLLENGEPLYRPGGHGSLIGNLNQINEDIIYIKNIDNVAHRSRIHDTIESNKKLTAIGIEVKEQIDQYLADYEVGNFDLEEVREFIENTLNVHSKEPLTVEEAVQFLSRPLRVCGVVRNQGEPGGGPFVVDNGDYTDLQICETLEIDQADPEQAAILENARYFNPVDLVCFVKDYKGEKYNLLDYVNEDRYFISEKSHEGKPLKALEHPGLWNGAMHHWNTLFVEVPLSTFNPVKTVNDLLKEGHRPLKEANLINY